MSIVRCWTGMEVRALREAMRLSVRDFADHLGVARRTAAQWVADHTIVPAPASQELLDAALRLAPAHARERFTAIVGCNTLPAPAADTGPRPLDRPAAPPGPHRGTIADDVEAVAAFTRALGNGSLGDAFLDHLDADVRRLASTYLHVRLPDLIRQIRPVRDTVFGMIQTNRHPAQLRRLHLAAARLCGLHAHALMDLGHYAESAALAATATVCAEPAGDANTSAWTRGLQSLIAYWSGDMHTAKDLAEAAAQVAVSGPVTVRSHSLLARAAAGYGDVSTTRSALAAADAARDRLAHDDEEPVGVFGFSPAKQAAYAGTALRCLGDPSSSERAIERSSLAIDLYSAAIPTGPSQPDILAAHLDLASAHLALGALDATGEHIAHAAAAGPEHHVASIRKRSGALTRQLTGRDDTRATALVETLNEVRTRRSQPRPGL